MEYLIGICIGVAITGAISAWLAVRTHRRWTGFAYEAFRIMDDYEYLVGELRRRWGRRRDEADWWKEN